jgi:pyruvate/2-oxoglutarate dehydrogenase complex dihydrolipoamide acyltransferase (E2) component
MIKVFVQKENVNDDSVIVKKINFISGDSVSKGQIVVEVETSKTIIDIESPEDGILTHNLKNGDEIAIGNILFTIGQATDIITLKNQSFPDNNQSGFVITKAAIKRSKELGISLKDFSPGWISVKDVEKKAGITRNNIQLKQEEKTLEDANSSLDNIQLLNKSLSINDDNITRSLHYVTENISRRKQSEIINLLKGKHEATSSTIGIDIAIQGIRSVEAPFLFRNSISDLIVFEASKLLKKYPYLNATYLNSNSIGVFSEINFGWSFDNGSNLKVLVLKNSDKYTLIELHTEVERLLELYESNQNLPIELLTSATVTFSDLSISGASFMIPLINSNQSMIIGVTSTSKNNFTVYATFDHRVTEGLYVSRFLFALKERIKSYFLTEKNIVNLHCYFCEKSIDDEVNHNSLSLTILSTRKNRGFIKLTLPNGEDTNVCRNCFDGI